MTATTASHSVPDDALPETFRPDVAIVGLGYVGLPLAMTFADGGATVLGVDVDPSKPVLARNGTSWIEDVPSEQVAELRKLTDNVSGYVAEAVARQLRHQLLGADLQREQEEHGAFTEEELTEALSRIFGTTGTGGSASAA